MKTTIPNPESGKLYNINWTDGSLETVALVDRRIAENASVPTLLCRDKYGNRFYCSEDMYQKTPKLAYEEYERELAEGVKAVTESIADAQARLVIVSAEHQRIQQLLAES